MEDGTELSDQAVQSSAIPTEFHQTIKTSTESEQPINLVSLSEQPMEIEQASPVENVGGESSDERNPLLLTSPDADITLMFCKCCVKTLICVKITESVQESWRLHVDSPDHRLKRHRRKEFDFDENDFVPDGESRIMILIAKHNTMCERILGLEHIVEIRCSLTGPTETVFCQLCVHPMKIGAVFKHVTCLYHIERFVHYSFPSEVPYLNPNRRRRSAYEKLLARKSVTLGVPRVYVTPYVPSTLPWRLPADMNGWQASFGGLVNGSVDDKIGGVLCISKNPGNQQQEDQIYHRDLADTEKQQANNGSIIEPNLESLMAANLEVFGSTELAFVQPLLDSFSNADEPFIGVDYLSEVLCADPYYEPIYVCRLVPCQAIIQFSDVITHIISSNHRLAYIKTSYPASYTELMAKKEDLESRLRDCASLISKQEINQSPCRINTRLALKFDSKSPLARKKLPQDKWAWERIKNRQTSPIEVAGNSQSEETDFSSSQQITQSYARRSPLLPTPSTPPIYPPLPTSPYDASTLCFGTQSYTTEHMTTNYLPSLSQATTQIPVFTDATACRYANFIENSYSPSSLSCKTVTVDFVKAKDLLCIQTKDSPVSKESSSTSSPAVRKTRFDQVARMPNIGELPKEDSKFAELPKEDSSPAIRKFRFDQVPIITHLPKEDANIAEVPKEDSNRAEVPNEGYKVAKLPKKASNRAEVPKEDSNHAELLRKDHANIAEVPKEVSNRTEVPKEDFNRAELPKEDSVGLPMVSPPIMDNIRVPDTVFTSADERPNPQATNPVEVTTTQGCLERQNGESISRVNLDDIPLPSPLTDSSETVLPVVSKESLNVTASQKPTNDNTAETNIKVEIPGQIPDDSRDKIRFNLPSNARKLVNQEMQEQKFCEMVKPHPKRKRSASQERRRCSSSRHHSGNGRGSTPGHKSEHKTVSKPGQCKSPRSPNRRRVLRQQNKHSPGDSSRRRHRISSHKRRRSESRSPKRHARRRSYSRSPYRNVRHCSHSRSPHRNARRRSNSGSPYLRVRRRSRSRSPCRSVRRRSHSGSPYRNVRRRSDSRSPFIYRILRRRSNSRLPLRRCRSRNSGSPVYDDRRRSDTPSPLRSVRRNSQSRSPIRRGEHHSDSRSPFRHNRCYFGSRSPPFCYSRHRFDSRSDQQIAVPCSDRNRSSSRSQNSGSRSPNRFYDMPDSPVGLSAETEPPCYESGNQLNRNCRLNMRSLSGELLSHDISLNHIKRPGSSLKLESHKREESDDDFFHWDQVRSKSGSRDLSERGDLDDHPEESSMKQGLSERRLFLRETEDTPIKKLRSRSRSLSSSDGSCPAELSDQSFLSPELCAKIRRYEVESSEARLRLKLPNPEQESTLPSPTRRLAVGYPDIFVKSKPSPDGSSPITEKQRPESRNDEQYCRRPKLVPYEEEFEALEKVLMSTKSSADHKRYELTPIDSSESESDSEYDPSSEAIVTYEKDCRKRHLSKERVNATEEYSYDLKKYSEGHLEAKRSCFEPASTLVGAREILPVPPPSEILPVPPPSNPQNSPRPSAGCRSFPIGQSGQSVNLLAENPNLKTPVANCFQQSCSQPNSQLPVNPDLANLAKINEPAKIEDPICGIKSQVLGQEKLGEANAKPGLTEDDLMEILQLKD